MRVLLLGGTSEIGLAILSALDLAPDIEVILAGRDVPRMEIAGKTLPCRRVSAVAYDATDVAGHQAFADSICSGGVPDLVIAATGVLIPQPSVEADVALAAAMIEANFTGQVTTLLAFGSHMKAKGSGTIVVLSSVAAVRPRRFNSVYGAAKAGLDAFARGYADSLHGSGVRLAVGAPGFRDRPDDGGHDARAARDHAREGRRRGSVRPAQVHLSRPDRAVWVPAPLAALATAMRLVPRPVWRRLDR